MKHKIFSIIACLLLFAQIGFAEGVSSNPQITIKFYDKTMYYPGDAKDNPVYVHVTIANKGAETLRFKIADDRMFSIDFNGLNIKNTKLSQTPTLIRKRTTDQSVYFREISLESGEEYSFVENLKDYLDINDPSIYYIELNFYPELYKNKENYITSNRLSLEIKPSPLASSSNYIPMDNDTNYVLKPEEISPDKVIEQTIIARQKNLWDQFFLYMDLEEMLKRDPVRSRKYAIVSAEERNDMIRAYKADLMLTRIDKDIVSIPSNFVIETTTYSQNEGSVKVLEWFDNGTFKEKKRYTYYIRQRDGIWQIYDYTVDNLGTE